MACHFPHKDVHLIIANDLAGARVAPLREVVVDPEVSLLSEKGKTVFPCLCCGESTIAQVQKCVQIKEI